ncbi:hypothetical protein [Streptacidiphilus jiangxiensis]|uniref:Uncharacterized protein n=1 Tax=Streptacidiphilus jiangxiensis TaxID=235985 RepID=A0A1H7URT1_STRJI|nr:hypothetical protein [Streptacidiphilus jiangxiensis]SEL99682.1 hypothetical protein SAMN05414137_116127 [Streptacidiphilus jiangxiensis]
MRVLVSGEVHVNYGQIYVESDEDGDGTDLHDAFTGQGGVGLCGGGQAGALFLITGLHTGSVGFTVESHDSPPPLDEAWEEVVEVPFRPLSEKTVLVEWGGGTCRELGLTIRDYRARYCAIGMEAGRELDTRVAGEPQADRYLLQFWPAPPEPARVVRQSGDTAAYWHDFAGGLTA